MRLKVVGLVIAASVIGGVGVGAAATALSNDAGGEAPVALDFASFAGAVSAVEVREPVLVLNDDGTATLSATLVNHMDHAVEIIGATGGAPRDAEAPLLIVWGTLSHVAVEPGAPQRIGGAGDPYRVRLRDRAQVGSTLPVTLELRFVGRAEQAPAVTFTAPVVARTGDHKTVANNGPNPDISVHDGII
ncbi:MAG: hypothetical protein ABW004_08220, partial [Aeromicrobium sp.]